MSTASQPQIRCRAGFRNLVQSARTMVHSAAFIMARVIWASSSRKVEQPTRGPIASAPMTKQSNRIVPSDASTMRPVSDSALGRMRPPVSMTSCGPAASALRATVMPLVMIVRRGSAGRSAANSSAVEPLSISSVSRGLISPRARVAMAVLASRLTCLRSRASGSTKPCGRGWQASDRARSIRKSLRPACPNWRQKRISVGSEVFSRAQISLLVLRMNPSVSVRQSWCQPRLCRANARHEIGFLMCRAALHGRIPSLLVNYSSFPHRNVCQANMQPGLL